MAESDPRRAVALAAGVTRVARSQRDPVAASVAERAIGLAEYHLEKTDAAVRHLRSAIRLGRRAESEQLAAEARMTLAAVLNWHGRPTMALRELDVALAGLAGVHRARAQAQRGAILHLLGRLDEAMDCYRSALPALRRAQDLLWVQRVLKNRGVLHAQRGEFTAAETDLRAAEALCRQLDLDLSVGLVIQNLGFVSMRRGDVPAALTHYDQAEACFRALSSRVGRLLSDRAELLLSVRLLSEARQAAAEAVRAFESEGRGVALPEARLLLAQAALLDGDVPHAVAQAQHAGREFTRHRRSEWAALARLTVLSCRLQGEQRRRVRIRELTAIAELLSANWPAAAIDARLAAARLALERGRPGRGRELLAQASRGRRRGVATLRARAWYAEALLRQANGNPRGALAAARTTLSILDEHVAGLGATDLRAHAAGHRTEAADLGLRIALQEQRPERVFEWAELGRASHLCYPPARPPEDPELARDLAELRATVADIERERGAGRSSARLLQRQVALERQIRDRCRQQSAGPVATLVKPPRLATVAAAVGDAALLEFMQVDGTLLALVVVDGRARLRMLGSSAEVVDLVDRVPFALRQFARYNLLGHSKTAADTLLRHTAGRLEATLLRSIPEIGDRPLIIIPTGPLQSLPWSILPSCRGRPVSVAPSATLWWLASRRPSNGGGVAVAAGPDLQGARTEAEAIAAIYGTTALTGTAATVDAVTAAISRVTLAHLATHGRVRADNPLFSALSFADGPLMVHDLEALDRAPHTVVLAACDTGRSVVRAGDELLGLGATLLTHGASQLVAPVLSVLDVETAPLMVAFHRLLTAGQPAAVALANAQQQTADQHPAGMAAVAPFICLGAGTIAPDLRPVP
jgi:tetratricopeptide (TPR) repeat protein